MSELAKRTIVGVVLIVVALGLAVVGKLPFAVMIALLATGMYVEWMRIVRDWGMAWKVSGFFYCLLPALALLWIRERAGPAGIGRDADLLIWAFIVTWSTDIGAFFAGRAIGGPKLAPSISPNKTIAGLVGGMTSAAALGWAWADFRGMGGLLHWAGAPLAVAAQGGDLFESWMKRRAGVKDSGQWLPGHGGLLDRLDGLVPVALLTAAAMLAGLL